MIPLSPQESEELRQRVLEQDELGRRRHTDIREEIRKIVAARPADFKPYPRKVGFEKLAKLGTNVARGVNGVTNYKTQCYINDEDPSELFGISSEMHEFGVQKLSDPEPTLHFYEELIFETLSVAKEDFLAGGLMAIGWIPPVDSRWGRMIQDLESEEKNNGATSE